MLSKKKHYHLFLITKKENEMTNLLRNIENDNAVMLYKRFIKGTRIMVELILRKIPGGYSFGYILEIYPNLETKDILAYVEYKIGSNAIYYD